MLTETASYDQLVRDFRWDIPARFNIATACCDRYTLDYPRHIKFGETLPMTGRVLRRELWTGGRRSS